MNNIVLNDIKEIVSNPIVDWTRFRNSNVLVTGANGMLPSYLVYTLLYLNRIDGSNIKVYALIRNKEKARIVFKDFLEDDHLIFVFQDVCTEIRIKDDLHYVIHAASQASPKYYGIDPVGTINANVIGLMNVLTLTKTHNIKSILYFSSGEVYGYLPPDKFPVKENIYGPIDPLKIRSCYAESKRMGESICVSWNFQYGTKVKIVRPFHSYGPGMLLNDGRVFADFISNIIHNEDIILRSDGSARRAFCYITDATISFFKILLDGNASEAYNVGNPSCEVSILQLANILLGLYPEKKLHIRIEILKDDIRTVLMKSPANISVPDISKLEMLGFIPSVTIPVGFRRTIDSMMM